MNPRQYEEIVCEHFRMKGYRVEMTSYSNDYGVDAFASKGKEKIAVQAKMYGNSSRRINRQCVMELYGAKAFFDCTGAVIVTDGMFLADALYVAKKLKIELLNLKGSEIKAPQAISDKKSKSDKSFEQIWTEYIVPLQGKTLIRSNGETNKVIKVDWSEIVRVTSNGNKGKIKIEIFKQTINKLLSDGVVTRDFINQNYLGRASSGIILILSQVPFFNITEKPTGLIYFNDKK